MDCSSFIGRLLDLCECKGRDGRNDPRRQDCKNFWNAHGITPPTKPVKPKRERKLRGMGDVVAAVTRVTGIDTAVKFMFGKKCGCQSRQNWLNKVLPFGKNSG